MGSQIIIGLEISGVRQRFNKHVDSVSRGPFDKGLWRQRGQC